MNKKIKAMLSMTMAFVLSAGIVGCGEKKDDPTPDVPAEIKVGGSVILGSITELGGSDFGSTAWGNNAADADIRTLTNGYATVQLTSGGEYVWDETVVVKGVVHYDFDLSAIDGTKVGQYPNYDVVIKTNESLVDFVLSLNDNIKPAICASADKFVADEKIKKKLVKEYGADVCDMECAAVLLTSLTANVPTLIIKAVSDGKGGAEEFTRRVNKASEAYLDTLKNIIERI